MRLSPGWGGVPPGSPGEAARKQCAEATLNGFSQIKEDGYLSFP